MTKLPINEIFETIQGEARFTGTPAVFVRLQFCDVGCGFCDTKHTWKLNTDNLIASDIMQQKTDDAPTYSEMSVNELVLFIDREFSANHIVLTGGEPAAFDLEELTERLIALGKSVQIETSGTYPLRVHRDTWVTISPKINMPGNRKILGEAMDRANEFKHPVGKQKDIDELRELISTHQVGTDKAIWLQPLSQSKKATAVCVDAAIQNGFKVSIQTHKYMGVR